MSVSYRFAAPVQEIGEDLISAYHDHLVDCRIEYVFRSEPAKSRGRVIWGRARKVSGLNAFLATGADGDDSDFFVIEIAEPVWEGLTVPQRVALVDHELCHCYVTVDDDDEVQLRIRSHDVEEFRAVVERHGFWAPDVIDFAKTIETQLTLDGI